MEELEYITLPSPYGSMIEVRLERRRTSPYMLPERIPRFCLTYEEWMVDAVRDPEAYGLTETEVEYYNLQLQGIKNVPSQEA